MKKVLGVLVSMLFFSTAFGQLYYTSLNNYSGNWEAASSWTKQAAWMADPPPSTTLGGGQRTDVYGYITRNGDLTLTGGTNLHIYDTLVIAGNLTIANNGITVHPNGLLVILGNLTSTTSGGAKITNNGNIVAVGEFTHWEGTMTGGTDFYIFDDTPFVDNSGGETFPVNTEDEQDLENNDPVLADFIESLGVACGGYNSISSSQTICNNSIPATITGSAVSGATYLWESSTTSATAGFNTATGTATNQNYTPGVLTQTTWYRRRIVKTSPACTHYSTAIEITVFNGSVWTGASSNVFSTAGNWCGGTPTNSTNSLIPAGAPRYPTSGFGSTNDLTIHSGASITLNSSTLSIYGNLTNNGTIGFQNTTDGIIAFVGNSQQTISGGPNTFNNMTVNNSTNSQIVFQSNISVNRTFTLSSGIVNLSTNSLTLGTAANNETNAGTLNYSNGRIINGTFTRWMNRNIIVDNNSRGLFPMGTATDNRPLWIYYPVNGDRPSSGGTLSVTYNDNNTTTTGLNIADTGGPIVLRHNSSWSVSSGNGLANGTYTLKAGGTGFTVGNTSDVRLMRSNGTIPGSTYLAATGSTVNFLARRSTVSLANLTGEAVHIGSTNASMTPLPITLLSFSGVPLQTGVALDWSTVTEENAAYFQIERSSNGISFDSIGMSVAAGNSNILINYDFQDDRPFEGKNYYRLKSVDFDGSYEYSKIVLVNYEVPKNFNVYPNPYVGNDINLNTNFAPQEEDLIVVLNTMGIEVTRINPTGKDVNMDSSLKPGVYFFKYISSTFQKTVRVVKAN